MAKRFISASERAKTLAQGLVRYANWMDSNQKPGNIHQEYWQEWINVWGHQMADQVREVHRKNFDWCTHYKEE